MHKAKVLMLASVASMIDQFNMANIRLMQQLGYEVHVACNFKEGNTCDAERIRKLKKRLHGMDVPYHQWDCPRGISSVRSCFRAYCQIRALMERHSFAWMHCHSPVGGALARVAAHRGKVKAVYTAHGFHFYKGAPLRNWLFYYPPEKLLSYWTDVLVTVNNEDYAFAKKHFKAARICQTAGVGIQTARFLACRPDLGKEGQAGREAFRKKYGFPADAKILLSVGELSRRKNHQLVISALPQLDPAVCFLVCGQGRLHGFLAALAEKTGVRERVCLLGYVDDLREIYKNADIFVFPSLQEGLPTALAEAMAAGLPCLVSDIRGNREMVCTQSGRFTSGDREDFLRKLAALLHNDSLREENREQMRIQSARYDAQAVEKQMLAVYRYMGTLAGAAGLLYGSKNALNGCNKDGKNALNGCNKDGKNALNGCNKDGKGMER